MNDNVAVGWESSLKFYTKPTRDKLTQLASDFNFSIEPNILDDHEQLATLRWMLQNRLGKNNRSATRAMTNLYFTYLRRGRAFLHDDVHISKLFDELDAVYGSPPIEAMPHFRIPKASLIMADAKTVNSFMEKYHFLGYGRTDSCHLAIPAADGNSLAAAATFSPWDMHHATPTLEQHGIKPSEVLVLSRLLSLPGTGNLTLSQFIAALNQWVWKEMREIKIIVTYCNPNAGHYGTVYRGANFRPLCAEHHRFIPFSGDDYVSPRRFEVIYDSEGEDKCRHKLRRSVVDPMPLLIYYYPIRLNGRKAPLPVGHCVYPYRNVELT